MMLQLLLLNSVQVAVALQAKCSTNAATAVAAAMHKQMGVSSAQAR
jgi:spore maturation protein SpmB